ncbi:epsin-2-like isoform X1 [Crassostrea virginica]|uniref:Epsin-2-like isoform X1 n=1 Tax=Crassostrea virginica TaxID=6565 RepID=A0A8B8CEH6_CRAVI|nr:epsin-2-like isoform X1 [Crassostrea virginica]XP_022315430.1 epsin-2-like isoform X1 [Crassostrea virginica]
MSNMPPLRRTLKNVVKNYSEAQVKVREATSNDPWGPSSTLMGEIADLTYNVVAFTEIMQMIWKRLNDHGKNWRHVYKSLVLLDYIIKTGSEKVAQQCKENIYAIQTLRDFQHREDNKDQGMNVREKAKQLVALLKDDERLRNERAKALKAKERFAQNAMGIGSDDKVRYGAGSPSLQTSSGGYSDPYGGAGTTASTTNGESTRQRRNSTDVEYARPSSVGEEEIQLQLALAMSKEEHEESIKKQKSDDIKLQLAIEESRKHADEERRKTSKPQQTGLLDLDSPRSQPSDPWGAPMPQPPAPPTDPWGAPLPGPPGQKHHPPAPAPAVSPPPSDPWGSAKPAPSNQSDPWGMPMPSNPSPPLANPATAAGDPWGAPVPSSGASASSPWGGSPVPTQQPAFSGFDSGTSSMTNGGTKPTVDDDFDLLSSRNTAESPAKAAVTDSLDLLGNTSSSDPWDLNNMNKSLPAEQQRQQKDRKTPQDFLGENANLVNLDQLVTKSESAGNNPFASGGTNPFELQQQQNPQRMTLNQLQSTAYSTGFSQTSSSGLLPQPLVPTAGMSQQQQGYNPFL